MHKCEHRPIVRHIKLYRMLEKGPVTVKQVQEHLLVCRRTVYNMLNTLEDAGAHLISDNYQWTMISKPD